MRRALSWLGLMGLLLVGPGAWAHGASKSYAEVRVAGRGVEVRVSFAAHDLTAATPGLDADGDGRLMPEELARGASALAPHLSAELQVQAGLERPEAPCRAEPAELRGLGSPVEEVQAELRYRCPGRIGAATVTARFLPELEPPHVSVATLAGPGVDATHVFSVDSPETTLRFEVPPLGAEVAGAARRVLQGMLTPAAVLLALALAFGGGEGGALAVLVFALACGVGAAQPSATHLAWLQAAVVAAGAALCAWRGPAGVHAAWAATAGAALGWGAAAGLGDAEAPVRWGALAAAALAAGGAGAGLRAAAARARRHRVTARTVAAGLAAGAVAVGLLGG